MAHATRIPQPPPVDLAFQAALDGPAAFARALIEVQQAPLQALFAWQCSLAAIQQELWDEWVCRFAGGVPIDA